MHQMCDILLPLRAQACLETVPVDILEYRCSLGLCEVKSEHFEYDLASKDAVPSLNYQCNQFGAPHDQQSIEIEKAS